jgi:hypothetical protein
MQHLQQLTYKFKTGLDLHDARNCSKISTHSTYSTFVHVKIIVFFRNINYWVKIIRLEQIYNRLSLLSYLLQALLYRCPEGYLFSSAQLRCAKKQAVTCTSGSGLPDFRSLPVTQLMESELEAFFTTWG